MYLWGPVNLHGLIYTKDQAKKKKTESKNVPLKSELFP